MREIRKVTSPVAEAGIAAMDMKASAAWTSLEGNWRCDVKAGDTFADVENVVEVMEA